MYNKWKELQKLYTTKDSKLQNIELKRKLYSYEMIDCGEKVICLGDMY